MIRRLHHAQITIPKGEEEQGKQFYCDVLELEEVKKPGALQGRGGFWLSVGKQEVHVGTEADVNRLATKAHLAYEVFDLAYWENRLREHGIEMIEAVPIPGYERFEFRDPFGNRVEMIQRAEVEDEGDDLFRELVKSICRHHGISARKPRFEKVEHLVTVGLKNHLKDGVDPECFIILNGIHRIVGQFGIKYTEQLWLYPNSRRVDRIVIQFEQEDYDLLNWRLVHGMDD